MQCVCVWAALRFRCCTNPFPSLMPRWQVTRWFALPVILHLFVAAWMASNSDFLYTAPLVSNFHSPSLSSTGNSLVVRLAAKHVAVPLLTGLMAIAAVAAIVALSALGSVLTAVTCRRGGRDSDRVVLTWAVVDRAMGSQCCCKRRKLLPGEAAAAVVTPDPANDEDDDAKIKLRKEAEEAKEIAMRLLAAARSEPPPPDFDGRVSGQGGKRGVGTGVVGWVVMGRGRLGAVEGC